MNAQLVIDAILALDAARQALRCGDASIARQMRIADDCSAASARLRVALEDDVPDVKIEDAE